MSVTPPPRPARAVRLSDIRGLARLATTGVDGVSRIAEGVHASVLRSVGVAGAAPAGVTNGLTGMVYRSVRGLNRLVGHGIDAALAPLARRLDDPASASPPAREAALAALNGVVGDHLAATCNPLATAMRLRRNGTDWVAGTQPATGKVALLIHGLCMNDMQWRDAETGHDHGDLLAALGYTPVYLVYNTGRHVADNGQELADQLDNWLAAWPLPVEELVVLAHSMGGLVARSACHQAERDGRRWPALLRKMVFLGTPHHGAPLERAGNLIDQLLGSSRYSAPFARLGHLRSAGITDLRHGCVRAEHPASDRFAAGPDPRTPLPLPAGVDCYTIAASTARQRSPLADRLLGDGLVPLPSALGEHPDPAHTLAFPPAHRHTVWGAGHFALLHHPDVTKRLQVWLASNG